MWYIKKKMNSKYSAALLNWRLLSDVGKDFKMPLAGAGHEVAVGNLEHDSWFEL